MILYNILIFTFGFWNVFKKNKSLSRFFGLAFMAALTFCAVSLVYSTLPLSERIFQGITTVLSLSILGFILIVLDKNKIAQIGAVIMIVIGANLYISNPHTPIDPELELDKSSELILRLDHDSKKEVIKSLGKLSYINEIQKIKMPVDAESTELDDYITIDVINDYDIDLAISEISQKSGVEWIEPNEIMKLDIAESEITEKSDRFSQVVNDPMAHRQWNMAALNMENYYPLFEQSKYRPKRTAKLFILDSGVNPKHEDISSNFLRHRSNDTDANESDGNGHGTHCAGVASAISNNQKGIASMNPGSQWMTVSSVKVMSNFGIGTQARVIEGIIEAVDAGADVISMSLGGRSTQIKEESYNDALKYAQDHNVIIVAAAGNNAGDASKIVPANSEIVITVTAVDRNIKKAQFSNYITNTNYGVAAPGTSIMSPWKGGRYSALDGTSMAAPHVSGLIAVMRSLNPKLTTEKAYEILNRTGRSTKDVHLTGKMIDPAKAIKATVK